MMLLTGEQMRALDRLSIARHGVPSLTLMENAGRGVARIVDRQLRPAAAVAIVLGKGNNAGDGLVAARYLAKAGHALAFFLTSPPDRFSPDAATNWRRLRLPLKVIHEVFTQEALETALPMLKRANVIVDALFGTGLNQQVTGHAKAAIEWINASGRPIVSIDIPSGLSADTGEPLGIAVRAGRTATLGFPKLGLVMQPGYEYAGAIEVVDIGVPPAAAETVTSCYHLTTVADFAAYWPKRDPASHKGTFGHLLVIAGSIGKIGAGFLASRAALRCGTGLVTYALPSAAYEKMEPSAMEAMLLPLPDGGTGRLTVAAIEELSLMLPAISAVAVGPGLGTDPQTIGAIKALLSKISVPLVVDADGLNAVATDMECLRGRKAPTILTPHPGEMARLCNCSTATVQAERLDQASRLATAYRLTCILKGYRSITALADGNCFVNPTGNPGLATAGTGDVLTGTIGGLLAQRIPADRAAIGGVYLHGLAGDLAAQRKGATGMIAGDVIEALPDAIRLIESSMRSGRTE
ncbi:MAG: NAD(P)H-hydrate dehydratase [Deltaproteobacteria bacterium]|nr:NAD(P)H-hydrate dehydratase [Deltaproteobacteria bacterium]